MNTTVDGEFQKYAVESGAYIREHFFGPDPRLRKMVEHLTDDELQQAAARRPRLPQALRGVQDRGRARGRAHRDPRQDGEGLDARRRLRGAQRDAPDQEDDGRRAARRSATASTSRSPTRRSRRASRPTTTRATDSPEYEYLMERRRALDGFLPDRVERSKTIVFPRDDDHRPAHRGHRREGAGVDDDRVHAAAARAAEGSRVRAARRADHPRRGAHVRHRRAVRRVQDLRAVRSAVRAGRRRR